jgi:hypothetical protein
MPFVPTPKSVAALLDQVPTARLIEGDPASLVPGLTQDSRLVRRRPVRGRPRPERNGLISSRKRSRAPPPSSRSTHGRTAELSPPLRPSLATCP